MNHSGSERVNCCSIILFLRAFHSSFFFFLLFFFLLVCLFVFFYFLFTGKFVENFMNLCKKLRCRCRLPHNFFPDY